MVGGELAQQLFVQTGDEARIDNGRVDAGFFFEQRRRLFREGEERAEAEDSDPCAAVGDMIGVQTAEILLDRLCGRRERSDRHTDRDRILVLLDAPVKHGKIFVPACRREVNEVRNVGHHRDVVDTEVGHVVHAVDRRPRNDDGRRAAVDAQILRKLVVGALDKGGVYAVDRLAAGCRDAGSKSDCVFLRDADVDELTAGEPALVLGEAENGRRARGDHAHRGVSLHLFHHKVGRKALPAFALRAHERPEGLPVERSAVVPLLLVRLGGREALAFFGDEVHNDRMVDVPDRLQSLDDRRQVIAVRDEAVVQTHRAEQVAVRPAAGLAQQAQIAVNAAMVLRDGHIVVVYENNEAAAELSCVIERLERFAAGERAVTDDGDDIAAFALEVAALRQTAGKADRGRGVADGEMVMLALVRIAVAGDVVVVRGVEKSLGSAGQHLVRIGLMRYVEYDFILRRLENIVQSNGRLDEAEVRAAVAAVAAELFDECAADFAAQRLQLIERELFNV